MKVHAIPLGNMIENNSITKFFAKKQLLMLMM